MGFDPVSLVAGGVQGLFGLGQSIFSGRKKAEKQLNRQIDAMPKDVANRGIMDYYNTALSRYGVSPTDSALYKRSMGDIRAGQASAIAGLQDRRSGLAGTSSILRAGNRAALDANVAAEQERNRRFAELGGATGMKANEEQRIFQQNQMMPWELKTNLAGQKLQGANQRANAGAQNIFNALGTLASSYTAGENRGSDITPGISAGATGDMQRTLGGVSAGLGLGGRAITAPNLRQARSTFTPFNPIRPSYNQSFYFGG